MQRALLTVNAARLIGRLPRSAFTATPGPFTFGVCPTSTDTNPICSVPPGAVPKIMDTIPPPTVSQDTELDPLSGPVVIQGVAVP